MFFIFKVIVSGLAIALASNIAGRNPVLAGFIIALPLMSILSIPFSYYEYRDMEKINTFAVSILTGVPLSLFFFLPFVLNRWLKMNFALTYASAFILLFAAFQIHSMIFRKA